MDRECIRHDEVKPAAVGILKLIVVSRVASSKCAGCERITKDVSERGPRDWIGDETQQLAGGAATLKVNRRPEPSFVDSVACLRAAPARSDQRRLVGERRQHGLAVGSSSSIIATSSPNAACLVALRVGCEVTCSCVVRTRPASLVMRRVQPGRPPNSTLQPCSGSESESFAASAARASDSWNRPSRNATSAVASRITGAVAVESPHPVRERRRPVRWRAAHQATPQPTQRADRSRPNCSIRENASSHSRCLRRVRTARSTIPASARGRSSRSLRRRKVRTSGWTSSATVVCVGEKAARGTRRDNSLGVVDLHLLYSELSSFDAVQRQLREPLPCLAVKTSVNLVGEERVKVGRPHEVRWRLVEHGCECKHGGPTLRERNELAGLLHYGLPAAQLLLRRSWQATDDPAQRSPRRVCVSPMPTSAVGGSEARRSAGRRSGVISTKSSAGGAPKVRGSRRSRAKPHLARS